MPSITRHLNKLKQTHKYEHLYSLPFFFQILFFSPKAIYLQIVRLNQIQYLLDGFQTMPMAISGEAKAAALLLREVITFGQEIKTK